MRTRQLIGARIAAIETAFEAHLRIQDAPRAWSVNSRRLAMTILAKPNRLNSCASFQPPFDVQKNPVFLDVGAHRVHQQPVINLILPSGLLWVSVRTVGEASRGDHS